MRFVWVGDLNHTEACSFGELNIPQRDERQGEEGPAYRSE